MHTACINLPKEHASDVANRAQRHWLFNHKVLGLTPRHFLHHLFCSVAPWSRLLCSSLNVCLLLSPLPTKRAVLYSALQHRW